MDEDRDTICGRTAIQLGFVNREQLAEALDAKRKAAELAGLPVDLPHVLERKKFITSQQEQELRDAVAQKTGEARIIGPYEVVSKLGRGGMGVVYEARHTKTGERVALKILPPSIADPATIARFRREAEIVRELDHTNIVKAVEVGYDSSRKCHFCALEYVDGEGLAARIERLGRIRQDEAFDIARQVARALQHAHFSGLVHRDVKPENIMVMADGTVKLLDLGLARQAGGDTTSLTVPGHFVGSPHYASPEQVTGNADIDVRTDIYSLGATLYHMLTGRPPFEGDTAAMVLNGHLSGTYAWPRDLNPALDEDACWIVARMMARERELRYQSPKELLRDIDLMADGHPIDIDRGSLRRSMKLGAAPARPGSGRAHAASTSAPSGGRARKSSATVHGGRAAASGRRGTAAVGAALAALGAAVVFVVIIAASRGCGRVAPRAPAAPPPASATR